MATKIKISVLVILTLVCMVVVMRSIKSSFRKTPYVASQQAVRHIGFWGAHGAVPLEDKVMPAYDEVLEYLLKDNEAHGWSNRPVAFELSAMAKEKLHRILKKMPEPIHKLMRTKLAGIIIVRDLGGTGYTENILDDQNQPVAGFIILDELIFTRAANEWATWKERSAFKNADIQIEIEAADNNFDEGAIEYILLHEFGHVASIGTDLHPRLDTEGGDADDPQKFRFSKLSWRYAGADFMPLPGDDFPQRAQLAFYRGGLETDVKTLYSLLAKTNFPTLYGSTNIFDDFAESFASYVHTVMLKKPYIVKVNGLEVLHACWGEERCAEKEKILRELLQP